MTNQIEVWKDVKGYEGYYQISNFGKVKSLCRVVLRNGKYPFKDPERIMKHQLTTHGYPCVHFRKDGKRSLKTIHRLICEAFIPNHENKPFINHKDGNKLNYSIENLEWCTPLENSIHAFKTGLGAVGDRVGGSKLSDEKIKQIISEYNSGNHTYFTLAKKYNVSFSLIGQIVRGVIWKHINAA